MLSAQATAGTFLAFTVLAGIVVGGTSIMGGEGAVWRTVVGCLFIALIGNGFNLLGLDPFYQQITLGHHPPARGRHRRLVPPAGLTRDAMVHTVSRIDWSFADTPLPASATASGLARQVLVGPAQGAVHTELAAGAAISRIVPMKPLIRLVSVPSCPTCSTLPATKPFKPMSRSIAWPMTTRFRLATSAAVPLALGRLLALLRHGARRRRERVGGTAPAGDESLEVRRPLAHAVRHLSSAAPEPAATPSPAPARSPAA